MTNFEVFYYITKSELFRQGNKRMEISRPRILGIMLHEDNELVVPKNLKYFRQPLPSSFPLNLNLGYEDYKVRNESYFNSTPRKVEKYLMESDGRSFLKSSQKQKICTSRNVLKSIMMTPFQITPNHSNDWTIRVIRFQDVIYMTKEKLVQQNKERFDAYHFKLQQYCFSDSPYKEPKTDDPIDANKQMSCVYLMNVDDFEVIYSGEIVGVESTHEVENFKNETILNKCHFVMTKVISDAKRKTNWKREPKLYGTWIQCYLSYVKTLYVGFRTKNGFVNEKLTSVNPRDIPKGQSWNPGVCKRFMRNFLVKVQERMSQIDCPYTVYKFSFDSKLKMIKCRVYEGKTEHSFLSEGFIQYMQSL